MFRVVERSKLSRKFGNETFMDCHLSPSEEEEDAFVAETLRTMILLDVDDDDVAANGDAGVPEFGVLVVVVGEEDRGFAPRAGVTRVHRGELSIAVGEDAADDDDAVPIRVSVNRDEVPESGSSVRRPQRRACGAHRGVAVHGGNVPFVFGADEPLGNTDHARQGRE